MFKTLSDWWRKVPRQYRVLKHNPPLKDCYGGLHDYTVEYRNRLSFWYAVPCRPYAQWWHLSFAETVRDAEILIEKDQEKTTYAQTVKTETLRVL